MTFDLHTMAQISAARALNSVAEGVALALLCSIVLRIFAARSSILRFVVWFFTLLGVVGLPFLLERSAPPSTWQKAQLTLSTTWATALFSIWAAVAFLFLVRLGLSVGQVRRLKRESREILSDSQLLGVVEKSAGRRRITLCVSDKVQVPSAVGFFRPSIILPQWTLREFTPEELKVIVLHEVAHLGRWDDWTNLLQKMLKALFFFHPAVWWIERRLALEREMACDEIVLRETRNPHAYARSLVAVAEKSFAQKMRLGRALSLAQSALGRIGQISLRIGEILKSNRAEKDSVWRPAIGLVGSLTAVVFMAMPYAPRLIAFANRSGPATTSQASSLPQLVARSSVLPAVSRAPRRWPTQAVAIEPEPVRSSRRPAPRVVLASTRSRPPYARMLILVEKRQMDAPGQSWSLSVWQISSQGMVHADVEETIIVNSI
ncbi:MAG: M56 family metallopeptidase [Acidobacteria bacterium]|nr:M56 family metallopeptidase [Acidobacteriota bacterium]